MVKKPARNARASAGPSDPHALMEFFAHQRTPTAELPDPRHFLENLTRGVLEVFAGVREVDQLARWLTEDAYRTLMIRANLATRARSARGVAAMRPIHTVMSVHHSAPADSIVEAVVIVQGPARTRAIAVRLEGMDRRWRATSLALL